jgi:hypothetical protein
MGKVHVTGSANGVLSSVESFVANLPELLGAMAVDPRCLVAVCDFTDGRYVQFWVQRDGTVISEVVSNTNIGDAVALSEHDEDELRAMGWIEPSPGPNPNWRYECSDVVGLIRSVDMVRRAVFEVLGERPANSVSTRTWSVNEPGELTADQQRVFSRVHFKEALAEIERDLEGE